MSHPLNYATPQRPSVPAALKVVGWLFIVGGILSAIDVISDLFNSNININFGVLGIFIGRGLLRCRPGWRTLALLSHWISFIAIGIVAFFVLQAADAPANVKFGGSVIATVLAAVMLIPLALIFACFVWSYRVLVRPDVRHLFQPNANTPRGHLR